MKKLYILLLLFPALLQAQKSMRPYYHMNSLIYYPGFSYFEEPFAPVQLRKKLHIQSVQSVTVSKRGRKQETDMTFNAMGRTISYMNADKKIELQYESDTLERLIISTIKHHVYKTQSTYVNGKPAATSYFKDGQLTSTVICAYNDQQQITSCLTTTGKKTYEIRNTYTAENKLQRTTYLVRGKLQKEWIYECRPEGEVVASKTEALSSFCTYQEESADGSYTTFTRSLLKGKPHLFKQTFNKDSVRILAQTFLQDSLLIRETRLEGNTETTIFYKKSGKISYRQVVVSNDSGNILSREFFQGKRRLSMSKSTFALNTDGTTHALQRFSRGRLQYTTTYVYGFSGK
jgi:antitoxin component YwqK of YwqJK toxin-antitoxin module